MAVAVGNGLMPMGLVFLRLAPKALQYLPLAPVTAAKLQGFTTNEIVVTLAAVAKLNDFCHRLHTLWGYIGTISDNILKHKNIGHLALNNAHLLFNICHFFALAALRSVPNLNAK
jgi:hypothetical protein